MPNIVSSLGGGLPGGMPNPLYNTNNNSGFARIRFSLLNAWNTSYSSVFGSKQTATTPFRAINNAGDLLSRQNYSCGGPNQTFQSRPGMHGLKKGFGHIQSWCDNSGVPAAACNSKYVYDSSDYIRYAKQKAMNKNYNDKSYGGNDYSGSQVAIRAIRRY